MCQNRLPGNIFGGDDGERNNFEIVKWLMPLEWAINIFFYSIKMEFIGNLGMELCKDMTLPYVRSTSGRSVPVILFGGDDDDVNNFKLMMYYSF